MLDILTAGGWLMLPLLLSSIIALAITLERLWVLHTNRALPAALQRIKIAATSRTNQGSQAIREAMQAAGAHEVHQLEKHLSPLGTIASITPLLGLLGTVVGMIDVFQQLDLAAGNAQQLAGGISLALITTATGLSIAIPTVVMHRYFIRRVGDLVVILETEAQKILDQLAPGAELCSLDVNP